MVESDFPRVTRLLPDAVHHAVRPGTAVVRLETRHDRRGVLDGVWWPRSRDIAAELPSLITALTGYLGPITRVGLDTGAWEALPTRMTIDERVVHIDSFPMRRRHRPHHPGRAGSFLPPRGSAPCDARRRARRHG